MPPPLYFPFGNSGAPNAPDTFYLDPVTNEYLMPTIVSHPYLFKYIVATIVYNQISRKWNSSIKKYVYTKSNDIFSSGNELTISFINQFTEGTKDQEVINLTLDDTILQILNYDFREGAVNNTVTLKPEQIKMLKKWNTEYGILDDFYSYAYTWPQ